MFDWNAGYVISVVSQDLTVDGRELVINALYTYKVKSEYIAKERAREEFLKKHPNSTIIILMSAPLKMGWA